MRIGIDATTWWNRRGFGRYTRLLLTHMFAAAPDHEFVVFIDQAPAPEMLRDNIRIVQVKTAATVTEAAVASGSRALTDLWAFRKAVAAEPLDVMYFPAVYSWYPTGGKAPVVITFHDAIAEHYSALVFPDVRGRLMWAAKIWLAKRSARMITTVSEAAREEIIRYQKIPRERITVVTEAADPIFRPRIDRDKMDATRQRLGLDPKARLLVYVGGLAPHKNLLRLIKAFALAARDPALADFLLVFVGDPEGGGFYSHFAEISALVEAEPLLEDRVRFTGFVSDEDLVSLYSDAAVVAMPALSEGFGLPAAEAIACGTPVIAARGGAVEEVVGEAGLFFDPLSIEEIVQTILVIGSDTVRLDRLRAATLPRAARLSWSRAATEMLQVLTKCGGNR